jgi:hypothetical protein
MRSLSGRTTCLGTYQSGPKGELVKSRTALEQLKDFVDVEDPDARRAFAQRVLAVLRRAGYASQRKLYSAIQERKADFTGDTTRLTLPTWQHLYEESRLESPLLVKRLLELIDVLLPQYRGTNLRLLADPKTFPHVQGVGPLYPVPMRVPIANAFGQWLALGQAGPNDAENLVGEYRVYFPWLHSGDDARVIAQARARIYRSDGLFVFESFSHVDRVGPRFFAGQLRFSGPTSAVLIGFTSFVLPVSANAAVWTQDGREMLVHPYRLPTEVNGWWHGSTTFLDPVSHEYVGTVPHVMQRASPRVPSDDDWLTTLQQQTPLLRHSKDHGYGTALRELHHCTTWRAPTNK